MERLSEQLINCDRDNFRRIAHGMPEAPAERPQVEQTAEIFNALFSALRAAFPAAMAGFREQNDFNELRRQWVLAFQENGITTMAQVAAGMRIARRQEKPFLPSPGQFVAWCKEGRSLLGFSVDDVMTVYWKWRRLVFRFAAASSAINAQLSILTWNVIRTEEHPMSDLLNNKELVAVGHQFAKAMSSGMCWRRRTGRCCACSPTSVKTTWNICPRAKTA